MHVHTGVVQYSYWSMPLTLMRLLVSQLYYNVEGKVYKEMLNLIFQVLPIGRNCWVGVTTPTVVTASSAHPPWLILKQSLIVSIILMNMTTIIRSLSLPLSLPLSLSLSLSPLPASINSSLPSLISASKVPILIFTGSYNGEVMKWERLQLNAFVYR